MNPRTTLSSGRHLAHRATHSGRRLAQTFTSFRNGPELARGLLTGRPADLVFRTRAGLQVTCPNVAGARVPVYEVFAEDAYRLAWFTAGLPADARVLDIGAHVGCFSLAVAAGHPGARIGAYEASPGTAAYLARNVADNAPDGRVTAHNQAVASTPGTLVLTEHALGSSLTGLTAPGGGAGSVTVPAVTVADAAAALPGEGTVDLVKIDTEGAEYDLVLGSDVDLWRSVDRVVLEYHDVAGHGWPELRAFFAEAGLTVRAHEPAHQRQGTAWLTR